MRLGIRVSGLGSGRANARIADLRDRIVRELLSAVPQSARAADRSLDAADRNRGASLDAPRPGAAIQRAPRSS
jgi:hypothetical protein